MTYTEICKETLERIGIDTTGLTKDQIELLAEPIEAPENFMCDGEVDTFEAQRMWARGLLELHLTTSFINEASKKILG